MSARVDPDWEELDVEMLVVPNFVPSHSEKRRVRFLTALELHQWIEYGEDIFIDILY